MKSLRTKQNMQLTSYLQGPGITGNQAESQAKANKLIAIAEARKDCLAVISPNRETVVNVNKCEDTNN